MAAGDAGSAPVNVQARGRRWPRPGEGVPRKRGLRCATQLAIPADGLCDPVGGRNIALEVTTRQHRPSFVAERHPREDEPVKVAPPSPPRSPICASETSLQASSIPDKLRHQIAGRVQQGPDSRPGRRSRASAECAPRRDLDALIRKVSRAAFCGSRRQRQRADRA